jgi:hypothetical protein
VSCDDGWTKREEVGIREGGLLSSVVGVACVPLLGVVALYLGCSVRYHAQILGAGGLLSTVHQPYCLP